MEELRLAGTTDSSSELTSKQSSVTFLGESPKIADIAPLPTGTASCIACPRILVKRTASSNAKAPAATKAEYSPRLCPATNAGSIEVSFCKERQTATLVVRSAG